MLVLTRKVGEAIVLPELGIVIKVLEINGNKVRFGISAPHRVTVHREEVWERVKNYGIPAHARSSNGDNLSTGG